MVETTARSGGDADERWWRRWQGLVVTTTSLVETTARFGVDKERDQRHENCEIRNQGNYRSVRLGRKLKKSRNKREEKERGRSTD